MVIRIDMQLEREKNGAKLAGEIFARFGTKDVYEIAGRSGLTVVFERWHPVTVGEFDPRANRIVVNENAAIPFENIIAHELGHYFLKDAEDIATEAEEILCNDFAVELLNK